ncbi:hypothetical protein [Anaeromyxobacter paludicola]|uniref:hypothetical protein n=1 Tax=Anaeromyxobacter paludicola TaxID=2918171 RepID=UPI0020BF62C8|nr:hypothetical protein [Anaeromyxobacter paludicola]
MIDPVRLRKASVWRTKDRRLQTRCLWAAVVGLCSVALAMCPVTSSAQGLALSLEPGVAVGRARPRGSPLPSAASLKALLGVAPFLDLSVGVGFVGLPDLSLSSSSMSGMASTVGAGVRLKRPRDLRSFLGASPWVDVEALSVQGGATGRLGLAAGAGAAFPVNRARTIWLGPFVRYRQLVVPDGAGDRPASHGLFAGLTLEVRSSQTPVGRGVSP